MLMCGDVSQAVYQRGFVPPTVDDGWVMCELGRNCRNAGRIARLIAEQFGGAPPALGGPDANEVVWVEAEDGDAVVAAVEAQYERLIEVEGYAPTSVLFATLNRALRDQLRDVLGFVNFEHSSDAALLCETVHRVKGLEFDHVVLAVTPHDIAKDDLLYIGCSRAISGLTVVGPRAVAERLGLV
jgi:superfamily I DNA/RNA helicase